MVKRKSARGNKSEFGIIGEEVFYVERVVAKRIIGNDVEYKLKWKGYNRPEDLSWEEMKNCHCPDLIAEFENNQNKSKKVTEGIEIETIETSSDTETDIVKGGSTTSETTAENGGFEEVRPKAKKYRKTGSKGQIQIDGIITIQSDDGSGTPIESSAENSNGRKPSTITGVDSKKTTKSRKKDPKNPIYYWKPVTEGHKYKCEQGVKVECIMGVEKNPLSPGGIAFLIRYEDGGEMEMVPTTVLIKHESEKMVKFYEARLNFF